MKSGAKAGPGGEAAILYIFLPHPCPTRKKSTFINLARDICAHNFRDPAIKLRLERERSGVRSTISRLLYLLFDFVYIIFKLEVETDNRAGRRPFLDAPLRRTSISNSSRRHRKQRQQESARVLRRLKTEEK